MSRLGRRSPALPILWQGQIPIPNQQLSVTIPIVSGMGADATVQAFLARATFTVVSGMGADVIVTGKPGQGSQVLVLFDPDAVLTGSRITYYRFDVLDADENLIGELEGVGDGNLTFDAYASVKSTGTLTVMNDPRFADTPDNQPAFQGDQVVTQNGDRIASWGTPVQPDYFIATDAEAALIPNGRTVILLDSTGAPKEDTVFQITSRSSAFGFTNLRYSPHSAAVTVLGDRMQEVDVTFDQRIDWLNVRIRPMIRIARLGGGDDPLGRTVPAGVYLCAAPVDEWTASGLQRKVELADKLSILDQDIASGDSTGTGAYTAMAGSNVINLVKALIAETGELYPAIQPGTEVLASDQVWDVGTTRLKVINDLLTAAGYFSLYCDGWGQYRADPYAGPADRDPVYSAISPFSSGPDSLMDPAWTRDRDIYGIPNRVLLVGQGDGETAALTSIATNTDPASPYSFAARGRWITVVETGIEAVTQDALDTLARSRLSELTSVTNEIQVKHIYLPDLRVNSVVRFVNPDADQDVFCYVVTTTIPLDPLALCETTMRLVT